MSNPRRTLVAASLAVVVTLTGMRAHDVAARGGAASAGQAPAAAPATARSSRH